MIGTICCIPLSVWVILVFTQGHTFMRKRKILHSFSCTFLNQLGWNWLCYQDLLVCSNLCFFLSLRELLGDIIKNLFMISLFSDGYKLISFQLDMVHTTKCYSLKPVWMTLTFTQGQREPEIVQSICCKVAWSHPNFHSGWLRKGQDCKEIL